MDETHDVIVVGAGQAGLATSYCLTARGIEHLVLERGRVGESWRSQRWDSFCLVTPNWTITLPGATYGGDAPDDFMARGDFVAHLYGGADTLPDRAGMRFNVGERNIEQGWALIDHYGFTLLGVDVGDHVPRHVSLDLADGEVQMRRGNPVK